MKMFGSRKGGRLFRGAAVVGLLWMACVGMMMQARSGVAWAAKKAATAQSVIDKSPQEIIDDLKNHGYEVKLKQEDGVNVFIIESVNSYVLDQLHDQQVQVVGIIGGFSGIKQRFRFSTDDGSRVIVNGVFKSNWSGTRWTLRAWVAEDVAQTLLKNKLLPINAQTPVLTEKVKCSGVVDACDGGGGGGGKNPIIKWIEDNPLVTAGIVIVLIALAVLVSILIRNKKAEEARVIAEENRRREEEERRRREDENRRREEERLAALQRAGGNQNSGNTGTVISDFGGNGGGSNNGGKTLASIGSLKCIGGTSNGISFPLIQGTTRIGRTKNGNDIVLDKDQSVSSSHGSIIVAADGRVIYKDESRNGTTVDGQLVSHNQVEVHPGSKLEIGGSTFEVVLPRAGARPAASAPVAAVAPAVDPRNAPTMRMQAPVAGAPAAAAPTAVSFGAEMEVLDGPEKGRHIPISKAETTFGRDARDVILTESSVSRRHATLHFRDGKFILNDDGSAGGTKVNGESVGAEGRELHDKDEISFGAGSTKIRFRSINS